MSKPLLAAIQARLDALEQATFGQPRRRLTKRKLAELEGCSTREIDRRRERDVYVAPEVENGRLYWWSDNYRRKNATADTAQARADRDPRLRARKPATQTSPAE